MFNFFKKNKPSIESFNENNNQEKSEDSVKSSKQYYVRYSYEYLDEVPTEERNPCNLFCAKLEELSNSGRMWSMSDIQDISMRLGYDVLERRGAWIDKGDKDENGDPIEHGYIDKDGVERMHCKHQWKSHVVVKK
jgi:hypothetical protein